MLLALARNWRTLLVRGVAAVLFAVLTVLWPGISLAVLVTLFGAYAFVDGIFNIVGAVRGARDHQERWWVLLVAGVLGIAVGVVTFLWPGITAIARLYWIASWGIITGVLEIAAAIRLRKEIRNEWLLGLMGVLSILFGAMLMIFPGAGAPALLAWIAAFALVFGALQIALGIKLRSWQRRGEVAPPGDHALQPT